MYISNMCINMCIEHVQTNTTTNNRFYYYYSYTSHRTPSPPTKSFPTKSPRVELSGRPSVKFNGHENSHPLELRVCLSQTLRNPNS